MKIFVFFLLMIKQLASLYITKIPEILGFFLALSTFMLCRFFPVNGNFSWPAIQIICKIEFSEIKNRHKHVNFSY